MAEKLDEDDIQHLRSASHKIDQILAKITEEIDEEECEVEGSLASFLFGGLQDVKEEIFTALSRLVTRAQKENRENRETLQQILKNQQALSQSLKANTPPTTQTSTKPSYATVAASLPLQRRFSPPVDSHAVLLRPKKDSWLEKIQGSSRDIATRVKQDVAGVIAAARLRSGCFRLLFDSEKAKKRAVSQDLYVRLQSDVLEEDFPVEILAVKTSLYKFRYGEEHGRTEAVIRIQQEVQKTIPTARITRASWIHGKKTQEKKERGSLIVHFSRKEDQERATLKGIIIEGVVHTALLYNSRLQIPQCFKCSRWGHTQTTCKARDACGYCAGGHNTQECQKIKEKDRKKCINCLRQGHASWEKSKCPSWELRVREREQLRYSLLVRGAEIEREYYRQKATQQESQLQAGRKREWEEALQQRDKKEERRPVGRPKWNSSQVTSTQPPVSSFFSLVEEEGGEEEMEVEQ